VRAAAGRRPFSRRQADLPDGVMVPESSATVDEGLTPFQNWRLHMYQLLEDPTSSRAAKAVSVFILLTITISIVNFMVASCPWDFCDYTDDGTATKICAVPTDSRVGGERLSSESAIQNIEMVCIFIFTVEYLLRLLCCTAKMSPVRFLLDPLNVLDVLAIIPWYIDQIVAAVNPSPDDSGGGGGIFGVLRIVRLTRVLRVFKVSRSMQSMIVLVRTLKRSFSAFMILLTSIFVSMLLYGALLLSFERGTYNEVLRQYLRADGSPSPFLSIPHCMYWCMTTMTTVGYGDLYPVTGLGQVIAMVAMVSGIVVLSVPITVIGANFDEETREQHRINELRKRIVQLEKEHAQEKAERIDRGSIMARDDDGDPKGMQEVQCLLEDHRNNVVGDLQQLVSKSETVFNQLVRKVVIQSRVCKDTVTIKPPAAGGENNR